MTSINQTAKTQVVRVFDVLFVGPLMLAAGGLLYRESKVFGLALGGLGAATIAYNARNYAAVRAGVQT